MRYVGHTSRKLCLVLQLVHYPIHSLLSFHSMKCLLCLCIQTNVLIVKTSFSWFEVQVEVMFNEYLQLEASATAFNGEVLTEGSVDHWALNDADHGAVPLILFPT